MSTAVDLDHKYAAEEADIVLTGVQALVRVIVDQMRADRRAGARTASFVSGYPGSPLGGFDRELGTVRKLLQELRIVHNPGHNEDLAAAAVTGSQVAPTLPSATVDGVLGVWYGKAPGLDRSLDAIRHAQFLGTSRLGGVLAYVGDDPASKSSSAPSASELTLRAIGVPILEPGNIQETIELGLHGVAMSRASGLWTAIRMTTAVADSIGTAAVRPGQITSNQSALDWRGAPYAPHVTPMVSGQFSVDAEEEVLDIRVRVAQAYGGANDLNRVVVRSSDDWIGLASRGATYYELRSALRAMNLDDEALRRFGIRLLHVTMPDPIDPRVLRQFGQGLTEVFVIEEKRQFLETALREALYGTTSAPVIVGKRDEEGGTLLDPYGTLDADRLIPVLRARLGQRIDPSHLGEAGERRRLVPIDVPVRGAYLCSGCPHNTSLRVPEGALIGGGIGCHALAGFMDPAMFGEAAIKTYMGGEGAGWTGIEPFVADSHFIQNIGDGTYFHSGQLSVHASVAAGSNITYKLLFNGAIAMTGGQSTSASNGLGVPDLAEVLLRQGVKRIIVTTEDKGRYRGVALPRGVQVWDRTRLIEAQELLSAVSGVTVLIHDQQCAAEKRRSRKRGLVVEPPQRIHINERVCEGCGDCGVKSNCLSVEPVETDLGRKTQINQNSCNKDFSCLEGDCPAFLTVHPPRRTRRGRRAEDSFHGAGGQAALGPDECPEPSLIVPNDDFTVCMPGVGGTGVVTVNQVLSTAALLEGLKVVGLDQTGLSQKAGPVVSQVRISTTPVESTGRPTHGSVDLYLVFDILVGVSAANLMMLDATRSVAVVSTSRTPTGNMVSHVDAASADHGQLLSAVGAAVRPDLMWRVDSLAVTNALFGDAAVANVLLLGAAFQAGALPLSSASIERALELNGVAVDRNIQAFRWGRVAVADPERVRRIVESSGAERASTARPPTRQVRKLSAGVSATPGSELERLLAFRISDLVDYQDLSYARRYVTLVEEVRMAEARVAPSSSALAEAVARNLYKLMAYKDEYEVARLHLDAAERVEVERRFGAGARVTWNLRPPILGLLGERKIACGEWFKPIFGSLRVARRLRGTRLDPFGRTLTRRQERALIVDYSEMIRAALVDLDAVSLPQVVELAGLPDLVRGYEGVKLANIERYRGRVEIALAALKPTVRS